MILPQTSSLVLTILALSLLFLGAWASLFKAGGKWRFELFYLDFAIGVLLAVPVYSFTLGDLGYDGFSFMDDLQHAGKRLLLFCFLAGLLYNLGNMLMLSAVSIAGMSVAFPVSYGIALMLACALGFVVKPGANTTLVLFGCVLVFTAVMVAFGAYRMAAVQQHEEIARAGRAKSTRRPNPVKGFLLAAIGGLLMGSVGGMLARARDGDYGLGPYAAAALFGLGACLSSFPFNIFFMNLPVEGEPVEFGSYLKAKPWQHLLGLFAGVLWYSGILAGMVGTAVPENLQPTALVRFVLNQGPPILAALLGVVVWRELKGKDMRITVMGWLIIILYLTGLSMIGLASIYVRS